MYFENRKTPRIKTVKARTSKRFNQQPNNEPLTPDSITTAFSQTKLTNGQTSTTINNNNNNSNEANLDERLEKKRRERELYVSYFVLKFVIWYKDYVERLLDKKSHPK